MKKEELMSVNKFEVKIFNLCILLGNCIKIK